MGKKKLNADGSTVELVGGTPTRVYGYMVGIEERTVQDPTPRHHWQPAESKSEHDAMRTANNLGGFVSSMSTATAAWWATLDTDEQGACFDSRTLWPAHP